MTASILSYLFLQRVLPSAHLFNFPLLFSLFRLDSLLVFGFRRITENLIKSSLVRQSDILICYLLIIVTLYLVFVSCHILSKNCQVLYKK